MADQEELTFRGIDAAECTTFIRKIHKAAYNAGKQREFAWIADLAMTCFDWDALWWYDQQTPETQSDWNLLRRALLAHYVGERPEVDTSTQSPLPRQTSSIPLKSSNLSSSSTLYAPAKGDNPTFWCIRVEAPSFSGYVSRTFGHGEYGRCCTLTPNAPDAALVVPKGGDAHGIGPPGLKFDIAGSERDGQREIICVGSAFGASFAPDDTWSGAIVVARQYGNKSFSFNGLNTHSGQVYSAPWVVDQRGKLSVVHFRKVDAEGRFRRLKPLDSAQTWDAHTKKHYNIVGETEGGEKTLYFWSRKVWPGDHEKFVAQLYLERVVT